MTPQFPVLILSTVWPEPNSSAAGVRQMQWIQFFLSQGAQVTLGSSSKMKQEQDWGYLDLPESVHRVAFPLNESSVIECLKKMNPKIVLFDRFIVEEQYSHFVYEACPDALILLETQDLHLVRRARDEVKEKFLLMSELPPAFYHTETALRETAALERVDHAFVCSAFEKKLLSQSFQISEDHFSYLPFFYEEPILEKQMQRKFEEREGFVWVGNFRHAPNLDGLRWFRNEIWPRLKIKFPRARIKIYGAYPSEEVMQWHRPKEGVSVLGSPSDLSAVFESARVNLAPLRFGAGVKGKLLEGWRRGVPAVSTRVGVEGLSELILNPGASVADTPQDFAEACLRLHEDPALWSLKQEEGLQMMQTAHSARMEVPKLMAKINSLLKEKADLKLPRWSSKMLRHETLNSHRYFSKWIEMKEKKVATGRG